MDSNTQRAEAERWLGIAAKMLASRDLVGSRSFAIRGREADPTNPISEQIIAIVDTLIAAEKRVTNSGHHDWYSILQVSHLARDLDLIASQYRRLFLLLNPDHNHFPFADYALRAVADAWSVLSDPSKKWMYDSELSNFLQRSSVPPPDPEPVRVDSSAAATYQFFHQPNTQQQQWIHQLHPSEQPQAQLQERQLFQQQQQQWLPQTQLQQLLPEHQRPSQPQWLPQSHSPQSHTHQPQPQQQSQQQPWMPEQQQQQQQQRPPPPSKEAQVHRPAPKSKENPVPTPQLQRPQAQIPPPQVKPKQTLPSPPPPQPQPQPPPPLSPPVQTPPFQQQPQAPPQQPPPQPPQQSQQQPMQPPPQEPVREKDVNENGKWEKDVNENGNNENDCNETGSMDDDVIDVNEDDDGGEQIESFWTACPYCYYLYEYPKTFEDCTLRCQNCRRAFQAIPVPGPPGKGGAASFCSWGFFPLGFSMTSWKRKNGNNANGFGSNWMPFSPMFPCPLQQKQPRTKVWEIVDEDEDEFNDSDSSDDPDSSDDWGSTKRKGKKRTERRGRPRKKSNVEKEKTSNKDVANGENPQRSSQRLANHDVVNNKSAAKQMGKGVRGRKKLDLNVEFSNEVEDHAPVRREGNNGEEVVEFFEGLDEFLSTLPILHVVGDEKTKAS